jgi:hypothetical protein
MKADYAEFTYLVQMFSMLEKLIINILASGKP